MRAPVESRATLTLPPSLIWTVALSWNQHSLKAVLTWPETQSSQKLLKPQDRPRKAVLMFCIVTARCPSCGCVTARFQRSQVRGQSLDCGIWLHFKLMQPSVKSLHFVFSKERQRAHTHHPARHAPSPWQARWSFPTPIISWEIVTAEFA